MQVVQIREASQDMQYFSIEARSITTAKRRRSILRTFMKHGLALLLKDGGLALFRNGGVNLSDAQKEKIARNLRLAFEQLGPTFIKLGQVLSTRQDILPDFICDEFTLLLDNIPPAPFSEVMEVMQRELPMGVNTFRSIDSVPIGSASLATVYRGELQNGQSCAIKVVRPNIDKLFQTDIYIIKKWAKRLYQYLPQKVRTTVDLDGLLNDYWSSSLEECDMRQEAEHMEHHARIMERYERVRIPKVYAQPTKNILVMELIEGWSLKDFPVEEVTFEERFEMMFDLAHYYVESLLNGYYHADPHASNILIEKSSKKAVVIDWGMVGRMDAQTGQKLLYMVSLINQNLCEEAAEIGLQIVEPTEYTDIDRVRKIFTAVAPKYAFALQGQTSVNWGTAIAEVITFSMQNYCRIPSGLALWTKGWMATEATARWLLPEISYHRVVESYDTNILRNMLSHQISYKTNGFALAESARFWSALPRRMNAIFEKLSMNRLGGFVEMRMSEATSKSIHQMVNRVVLALICAASLMTSALFGIAMQNTRGSVVGIGLGTAATVMGIVGLVTSLFLIWKIYRSKRL